jgi:hypothetical protein
MTTRDFTFSLAAQQLAPFRALFFAHPGASIRPCHSS